MIYYITIISYIESIAYHFQKCFPTKPHKEKENLN